MGAFRFYAVVFLNWFDGTEILPVSQEQAASAVHFDVVLAASDVFNDDAGPRPAERVGPRHVLYKNHLAGLQGIKVTFGFIVILLSVDLEPRHAFLPRIVESPPAFMWGSGKVILNAVAKDDLSRALIAASKRGILILEDAGNYCVSVERAVRVGTIANESLGAFNGEFRSSVALWISCGA